MMSGKVETIQSLRMALRNMTVEALRTALARRGLDVVHAFPTALLPPLPHLKTSVPLVQSQTLVHTRHWSILVAHTKTIWPHLLQHYTHTALPPDPLYAFIRATLQDAMEAAKITDAQVFWPYERHDGQFVPFQRIAHAAGLAYLHRGCHLNLHRTFGPWFSCCALICLDLNAEAPVDLSNYAAGKFNLLS
jgi:hypothetical protein